MLQKLKPPECSKKSFLESKKLFYSQKDAERYKDLSFSLTLFGGFWSACVMTIVNLTMTLG